MLIAQLLEQGTAKLRKNGISNADVDARILLGHCLGKNRSQLFIAGAEAVEPTYYRQYWSYIERRAAREPVAYILEEREFWSLPFYVNRDVLIPRPETEFLVETLLDSVQHHGMHIDRAMDLCCGSGVIAVVLALTLQTRVTAVDISKKALAVTQKNSRRHGVEADVIPVQSDLFSSLSPEKSYPLIVSNPPYVGSGELRETLEPEVEKFEPHLALDGGKNGLDLIQRIAWDVLDYLAPKGLFFMEFGADQAAAVNSLFSALKKGGRHFSTVQILKDYSGRDRVLQAKVNNYSE